MDKAIETVRTTETVSQRPEPSSKTPETPPLLSSRCTASSQQGERLTRPQDPQLHPTPDQGGGRGGGETLMVGVGLEEGLAWPFSELQ